MSIVPPVGVGAGRRHHVDWIGDRRFGGRNARSRSRVASENSATWSPAASHASTARMPGPPALVTTATRRPAGSGCASRQAAMSNISSIVSARITPDCWKSALTATSLAASAAVWLPAAREPGPRAARFHGDDRLGARDAPRDAAEAARVAERFEVQQDDARGRVELPVLQQVVAGDIGLVADADERRQADAALPRELENREPERAALRREPDAAGRRHDRRERGVEAHLRRRVEQAHAVGADHPHPVVAHALDQLLLQRPAGVADLGEPGRDHHQRLDARRGAIVDDVEDAARSAPR